MNLVVFTKMFQGWSAAELADLALGLGVSGFDLAVRAGHCVNPDNVGRALPEAAEVFQGQGLSVGLVTTETSLTDPGEGSVRTIWRACADQGIRNVKIGYWRWEKGRGYWERVSEIRQALGGFESLGREFGVRTLVHTHSGGSYGSNCSGLMDLIEGFDPEFVGAYVDPAHLGLGGEPLPMGLDIVKRYLAMVAVKNARRLPTRQETTTVWKTDWCLLREGFVDWRSAVRELGAAGYDGLLSLHGEYSAVDEPEQVQRRLVEDAGYLREALSAAS